MATRERDIYLAKQYPEEYKAFLKSIEGKKFVVQPSFEKYLTNIQRDAPMKVGFSPEMGPMYIGLAAMAFIAYLVFKK